MTGTAAGTPPDWAILSEPQRQQQAETAARDGNVTTLVSLTTAFLALSGVSSPSTVRAYATGVQQYAEYSAKHGAALLHPGPQHGQGYVAAMLGSGRAPAGVGVKVAAARSLYRALQWAGATDADPFRDARLSRTAAGNPARPAYTDEHLSSVLAHADVHQQFLLLLIAHGGLRINEALDLTWADLDEDARTVTIRGNGRTPERTVTMSPSLQRAAAQYRRQYGPGGVAHTDGKRATPPEFAFRYADTKTARYHLKKAFSAAGVHFQGFHAGRRYAGARLLLQTRAYDRVAAHLGYSSLDSARRNAPPPEKGSLNDDLDRW